MNAFISRLLANKLGLAHCLTMLSCAAILRFPDFILGPKSDFRDHVYTWAFGIFLLGLSMVGAIFKQQNTTGIGTLQDPLKKPDGVGESKILGLVAMCLIPMLFLQGCENITPERKQQLASTGKIVGTVVARAAWQLAVNSLTSYADKDKKADYLDTAAAMLRTAQANKQVATTDDMHALWETWFPDKPHWKQLENVAVAAINNGVQRGLSKDQTLEVVAGQLNTTAANVRTHIESEVTP